MLHTLDIDITTNDTDVYMEYLMTTVRRLFLSSIRNPSKESNSIYIIGAEGDEEKNVSNKRYPGYDFHFGSRVEKEHPTDEVLFTINSYCGNDHTKKSSVFETHLMTLDAVSKKRSKDKFSREPLTYTDASWNKLEKTIRKKLKSLEFLQPRLVENLPEDEYLYNDPDITLRPGLRLVVSCGTIAVIQTLTHFGK